MCQRKQQNEVAHVDAGVVAAEGKQPGKSEGISLRRFLPRCLSTSWIM